MSTFDSEQWEKRGEDYFDTEVIPRQRVSQGLRFLGQHLGWSGDYFFPLTGRNFERRLLLDYTFGNLSFSRKEHPYIADANLVFRGEEGFTNWVNWEGSIVQDYEDREFIFPGVASVYWASGLPFKDNPYLIKGSHIYFPEPFTIEGVEWDPEIEYVESRRAWRAKIKEVGTLSIKRLAGPAETVEAVVIEWEPADLVPFPERREYHYGAWGSKNTLFNMQWLLTLLGVSGHAGEEVLKTPPYTVRYVPGEIDPGYSYNGIRVDGELLAGRVLKGLEDITSGSGAIVRLKVDLGGQKEFLFDTVEISFLDVGTNDELLIDITQEVKVNQRPPDIVTASAKDFLYTPDVYWIPPLLAGEIYADDSQVGTDDIYIRLPLAYQRGGEHWNKAEQVAHLFSLFGEPNDTKLLREYPGEQVKYYEEVWDNWREVKFFQEDYLVSSIHETAMGEDTEWEGAARSVDAGREEYGWKQARVESYDPSPLRGVNYLGWVGSFYERVRGEQLSGIFSKDLEEGKIIVARSDSNPWLTPNLASVDYRSTNRVKVAYCYFAADFSAAEDPVF